MSYGSGNSNGASLWNTRDELGFIDNTICAPAGLADQQAALEKYIANCARRFSWGAVDAVAVSIYANKRLREVQKLREKYGD